MTNKLMVNLKHETQTIGHYWSSNPDGMGGVKACTKTPPTDEEGLWKLSIHLVNCKECMALPEYIFDLLTRSGI